MQVRWESSLKAVFCDGHYIDCEWNGLRAPSLRMEAHSMAEGSGLPSTEEEVLVKVKKLRSLGVTEGDDEIRQALADVDNDIDKALLHLQANGKDDHEMEVGTLPDQEGIVVVEDHFGDGVQPPMEEGGTGLPPPYEESVQTEEAGKKVGDVPQHG